jgi:hypothetical protein
MGFDSGARVFVQFLHRLLAVTGIMNVKSQLCADRSCYSDCKAEEQLSVFNDTSPVKRQLFRIFTFLPCIGYTDCQKEGTWTKSNILSPKRA